MSLQAICTNKSYSRLSLSSYTVQRASSKAAVVGDTVGDPFKDTSGPALNIVMKLMAVLSLVFADTFYAVKGGAGVFQL